MGTLHAYGEGVKLVQKHPLMVAARHVVGAIYRKELFVDAPREGAAWFGAQIARELEDRYAAYCKQLAQRGNLAWALTQPIEEPGDFATALTDELFPLIRDMVPAEKRTWETIQEALAGAAHKLLSPKAT